MNLRELQEYFVAVASGSHADDPNGTRTRLGRTACFWLAMRRLTSASTFLGSNAADEWDMVVKWNTTW
jgi:hypothetical protein